MVMRSVTTPLEININGSDGLQYMQSYSSANGTSVITCTFALGTDPTTDQTHVQHGVDLTLSQLPQAVQSEGVSVQKSSGNITIAVAMLSTSAAVSDVAVSNYADLNVIENLKRVSGVGQVIVLGDRTYGMRIWVDPHKLQANNISVDTVLNAIKQNNADVSPGSIGQPPTTGSQPFQIPISINGRLQTPEEFKQIVLRRSRTAAICDSATSRRSSSARRTMSPPRDTMDEPPSYWRSSASRPPTLSKSRRTSGRRWRKSRRRFRPATSTKSPLTPPTSCARRSRRFWLRC